MTDIRALKDHPTHPWSFREIADLLGVSHVTVRKRYLASTALTQPNPNPNPNPGPTTSVPAPPSYAPPLDPDTLNHLRHLQTLSSQITRYTPANHPFRQARATLSNTLHDLTQTHPYTPTQLAEALQVSRKTIYNLLNPLNLPNHVY